MAAQLCLAGCSSSAGASRPGMLAHPNVLMEPQTPQGMTATRAPRSHLWSRPMGPERQDELREDEVAYLLRIAEALERIVEELHLQRQQAQLYEARRG